ncbi:uncharacterized protein LOC144425767 [Styela clava]
MLKYFNFPTIKNLYLKIAEIWHEELNLKEAIYYRDKKEDKEQNLQQILEKDRNDCLEMLGCGSANHRERKEMEGKWKKELEIFRTKLQNNDTDESNIEEILQFLRCQCWEEVEALYTKAIMRKRKLLLLADLSQCRNTSENLKSLINRATKDIDKSIEDFVKKLLDMTKNTEVKHTWENSENKLLKTTDVECNKENLQAQYALTQIKYEAYKNLKTLNLFQTETSYRRKLLLNSAITNFGIITTTVRENHFKWLGEQIREVKKRWVGVLNDALSILFTSKDNETALTAGKRESYNPKKLSEFVSQCLQEQELSPTEPASGQVNYITDKTFPSVWIEKWMPEVKGTLEELESRLKKENIESSPDEIITFVRDQKAKLEKYSKELLDGYTTSKDIEKEVNEWETIFREIRNNVEYGCENLKQQDHELSKMIVELESRYRNLRMSVYNYYPCPPCFIDHPKQNLPRVSNSEPLMEDIVKTFKPFEDRIHMAMECNDSIKLRSIKQELQRKGISNKFEKRIRNMLIRLVDAFNILLEYKSTGNEETLITFMALFGQLQQEIGADKLFEKHYPQSFENKIFCLKNNIVRDEKIEELTDETNEIDDVAQESPSTLKQNTDDNDVTEDPRESNNVPESEPVTEIEVKCDHLEKSWLRIKVILLLNVSPKNEEKIKKAVNNADKILDDLREGNVKLKNEIEKYSSDAKKRLDEYRAIKLDMENRLKQSEENLPQKLFSRHPANYKHICAWLENITEFKEKALEFGVLTEKYKTRIKEACKAKASLEKAKQTLLEQVTEILSVIGEARMKPEYFEDVQKGIKDMKSALALLKTFSTVLTTSDQLFVLDVKQRLNMVISEIRSSKSIQKNLKSALKTLNIQKIEDAIAEARRAVFIGNNEIRGAEKQLELLKKRKPQPPLSRENKNTQTNFCETPDSSSIRNEIDETSDEKPNKRPKTSDPQKLRLKEIAAKISRSSTMEICSYNKPLRRIHDIMIVVYLLLGEEEKWLENWENIRALMRSEGRKSFNYRSKHFNVEKISKTNLQLAHEKIRELNLQYSVNMSQAGALYYAWAKRALNRACDLDTDTEEPCKSPLHIHGIDRHFSIS